MGINANKKVKRRKVRINGNKNSTNNWASPQPAGTLFTKPSSTLRTNY